MDALQDEPLWLRRVAGEPPPIGVPGPQCWPPVTFQAFLEGPRVQRPQDVAGDTGRVLRHPRQRRLEDRVRCRKHMAGQHRVTEERGCVLAVVGGLHADAVQVVQVSWLVRADQSWVAGHTTVLPRAADSFPVYGAALARSEHLLDVPPLRRTWAALRVLPRTAEDVMTHGDLILPNVLVTDGRLAGIIDVSGMAPADPALDLVGAWRILEAGPRQVLRDDLRCGDLAWERRKARAFEQAIGLVWYYLETNPAISLLRRRTLHRIMADASSA